MPLLESTRQHWIYCNDQIWKRFQETDNWYYFTTRIGKQRAGYSDNGGCYVEVSKFIFYNVFYFYFFYFSFF